VKGDKSVIQMTGNPYKTICSTARLAARNYQQFVVSPPMSDEAAAAHDAGFVLGMQVAINMILHHGNCKFEAESAEP
jgi:hypothetical protein